MRHRTVEFRLGALARGTATIGAVALVLFAFVIPAGAQCEGLSARLVAKAVKKTCKAYDKAGRKLEAPDFRRVDALNIPTVCADAAKNTCKSSAALCYGDLFDAAVGTDGAFNARVSGRCPRTIGKMCSKAIAKEIRSPGDGIVQLERISKRCNDPIDATVGGVCTGLTDRQAVIACLQGEIASLAAAIAPPPPPPPPPPLGSVPPKTPADCGFPATTTVKPVVPGGEFDAEFSPWRRSLVTSPPAAGYEPTAANDSQINSMTPADVDGVNLSVSAWTYPVYNIVADRNTDCPPQLRARCFDSVTIEHVYLIKPWNPSGHAIIHVPIPTGIVMRPDPQADSHLAIVDWVHGLEYDFWACLKNGDGSWRRKPWPISQGGDGASYFACQAGGKLYMRGTGVNLIGPDSAKGSGFSLTGGLIRPGELRAPALIPHALAVSIKAPASGGPVAPANLSDGSDGNAPPYPQATPEGARLQLRPSLWSDAVIDAQAWTDVERAIARAMRDYGLLIADAGGSDIDFYAEDRLYDPAIYDGIPAIGTGPLTKIFSRSLFTPANFRIVAEGAHFGDNNSGARDLDGDGMFDSFEIAMGWNDAYQPGSPANAADDADGDGLSNLEEQRCLYSTLPDFLQVWPGFSANPPHEYPCNPYDADSDHDGFTDAAEVAAGTDATDPCLHP